MEEYEEIIRSHLTQKVLQKISIAEEAYIDSSISSVEEKFEFN